MIQRHRKRRIDGDIQEDIEAKAMDGWTPSQILRYLDAKLAEEDKGRLPPEIRTIQRIVKDAAVPDTSGTWSITDNEGEDARLVLDILAFILSIDPRILLTSKPGVTRAEARWIIRLRKAAPDAPARIIVFLFQLYMRREAKGITDTSDLDGYLALTPWRNKDCLRLYKRLVAKGWIPKAPLWFTIVEGLSSVGPFDPRFTGSDDDITEFERDIYDRMKRGSSPQEVAEIYNMHPKDVEDIFAKWEEGSRNDDFEGMFYLKEEAQHEREHPPTK